MTIDNETGSENQENLRFDSSKNLFESWWKDDGKKMKAVFLTTEQFNISLELNTVPNMACIAIRKNQDNPGFHQLALIVNDEGRSSLQVSDGKDVKHIDLFKLALLVEKFSEIKDSIKTEEEL
jgi:hypothetical protein